MVSSWQDLTWKDFDRLLKQGVDTVLLPVGTVEAHGVTPLGTDIMIPEAIAREIAPTLKAIIAPTVSYGITRSLGAYPGSLTVTSATFEAYLREILCSIASKKIRRIAVINGHGGQLEEIKNAALRVHQETGVYIVAVHWWILCQDIVVGHYGSEGGHAAVDETAAVLAIAPDKVKKGDYDESMIYQVNAGANIYPIPSTILIYKENTGKLDFDLKRAEAYFGAVCQRVSSFLEDVFRRWQNG